jgi:hypothetical protein
MEPVTGMVGKKVVDGVWNSIWKRLRKPTHEAMREVEASRSEIRELKQQLQAAHAKIIELGGQVDAKAAFERRKAELECLPDDDCLYRRKDGTGPYYCPTCLETNEKFVPLPHASRNNEGSFYCGLHQQTFETRELRDSRRFRTQRTHAEHGRLRPGWMRR